MQTTTEVDLKRIFGQQNLKNDKISLGEGGFESGTVLFPDDPMKRIKVLWSDVDGKRFPKSVLVGGVRNGAFSDKSMWHKTFGNHFRYALLELELDQSHARSVGRLRLGLFRNILVNLPKREWWFCMTSRKLVSVGS